MRKVMKNAELRRAINETVNCLKGESSSPFGKSGAVPDDVKEQLKAHLSQLLTCEQARACGLSEDAERKATESISENAPECLEWSKTLLDGERVTYEQAEKAIAELGEGWRMPTRKELESLVDTSRHDPAIDAEKFPDTKSTYYWTSTTCAWNDSAQWVVHFHGGYVLSSHRGDCACVRAVRSGQ